MLTTTTVPTAKEELIKTLEKITYNGLNRPEHVNKLMAEYSELKLLTPVAKKDLEEVAFNQQFHLDYETGNLHILRFAGQNKASGLPYSLTESYQVLDAAIIKEGTRKLFNDFLTLIKEPTFYTIFKETGLNAKGASDFFIAEMRKLYLLTVSEIAQKPNMNLDANTINAVLKSILTNLKNEQFENPTYGMYCDKLWDKIQTTVKQHSEQGSDFELNKGDVSVGYSGGVLRKSGISYNPKNRLLTEQAMKRLTFAENVKDVIEDLLRIPCSKAQLDTANNGGVIKFNKDDTSDKNTFKYFVTEEDQNITLIINSNAYKIKPENLKKVFEYIAENYAECTTDIITDKNFEVLENIKVNKSSTATTSSMSSTMKSQTVSFDYNLKTNQEEEDTEEDLSKPAHKSANMLGILMANQAKIKIKLKLLGFDEKQFLDFLDKASTPNGAIYSNLLLFCLFAEIKTVNRDEKKILNNQLELDGVKINYDANGSYIVSNNGKSEVVNQKKFLFSLYKALNDENKSQKKLTNRYDERRHDDYREDERRQNREIDNAKTLEDNFITSTFLEKQTNESSQKSYLSGTLKTGQNKDKYDLKSMSTEERLKEVKLIQQVLAGQHSYIPPAFKPFNVPSSFPHVTSFTEPEGVQVRVNELNKALKENASSVKHAALFYKNNLTLLRELKNLQYWKFQAFIEKYNEKSSYKIDLDLKGISYKSTFLDNSFLINIRAPQIYMLEQLDPSSKSDLSVMKLPTGSGKSTLLAKLKHVIAGVDRDQFANFLKSSDGTTKPYYIDEILSSKVISAIKWLNYFNFNIINNITDFRKNKSLKDEEFSYDDLMHD